MKWKVFFALLAICLSTMGIMCATCSTQVAHQDYYSPDNKYCLTITANKMTYQHETIKVFFGLVETQTGNVLFQGRTDIVDVVSDVSTLWSNVAWTDTEVVVGPGLLRDWRYNFNTHTAERGPKHP